MDNGMTLSDLNGKPFAPLLKDLGKTNADDTPVFLPFYGAAGASYAASAGYDTKLAANAAACTALNIQASNASAVEGYLVLLDLAVVPAAGATITPVKFMRLPTKGDTADGFAEIDTPVALTKGLVAVLTTSLTTYTPGALSGVLNASFY